MEPRYRKYQTEPGELLLLASSPLLTTTRFANFVVDSNLSPSRVTVSRMCPVPIPRYVVGAKDDKRQFPVGTNPSLLWHPLFWLPETLRTRVRYERADSTPDNRMFHVETEDEWVARVALTLSTAGVYDPEQGTWLDMLSVVGLDSEDEMVIDRLQEWLEGAPDEDIDRIDLSEFVDIPGQPFWSLRSIESIYPVMEDASYATLTNGTLEIIEIIVEKSESVEELAADFAAAVQALDLVIGSDIDVKVDDEDFLTLTADVYKTASEYTGTWADLVDGVFSYYRNALTAVRDLYWPSLQSLVEAE